MFRRIVLQAISGVGLVCHLVSLNTRNGNGRCLCNKKYQRNGRNLSCTPVTFASLIFLACIVTSAYIRRRKVTLKQENGQDQRTRESLYNSERYIKDLMDAERLEENDSDEVIEVPYLDFNSILLATNNASDANKLGRGGITYDVEYIRKIL
ncbi:hypothetical protein K1719_001398 [Acacia pycnantha]|nr:hypothetical protein K1719_001398 [Acacia pycnantha]